MPRRFLACMLAAAGCHAALPPPQPPRFAGAITADGGALGTWRLAIRAASASAGPDSDGTLELYDPALPERRIRLTATGRRTAPATTLHLLAGTRELALTAMDCERIDAIFQISGRDAFGSARFDCDLGDDGHVAGSFELEAGASLASDQIRGTLALGSIAVHPDRATLDADGVVFWDRERPRVLFMIKDAGALRVVSTARSVRTFVVTTATCRMLRLDRRGTGHARIEIDCPLPTGGRMVGSLEVAA